MKNDIEIEKSGNTPSHLIRAFTDKKALLLVTQLVASVRQTQKQKLHS